LSTLWVYTDAECAFSGTIAQEHRITCELYQYTRELLAYGHMLKDVARLTGHILWLAHGKKKATVYSFIDHVGLDWMDGVEAIACDMNSDFEEAFEYCCPHIQPVFDYFHIKCRALHYTW